jgi:four helix bundle protein
MARNLIRIKSFQFALDAIALYKVLLERHEYVLSKQFLRSATSIGANAEEADAAQTKKEFIAKISVSSKEARETNYWLRLMKCSKIIDYPFDDLILKSEELIRILTAIVKTSQRNV